jgi:hypothetical protein
MFKRNPRDVVENVQEILARFPTRVGRQPETSADPFVVEPKIFPYITMYVNLVLFRNL